MGRRTPTLAGLQGEDVSGAAPVLVKVPPGKLADAELHFNEGPLDGHRLIGFAFGSAAAGTAAT